MLVVARHATGQLHAMFGVPGTQQDVTFAAKWTSSNPAIIAVDGGVVTAVDIGVASVSVDYQGLRQTVGVTARRRTRVVGTIRVDDAHGQRTIQGLSSYVDGKEAGGSSESHATATSDVTWGGQLGWIVDPIVDPGSHTVAVGVGQLDPPNAYNTDRASQVTIMDADTMQTLEIVPLPVQSATLQQQGRITWTVQVAVFSS